MCVQTIIKDILTYYEILGKNKKGTILILHGWGQNSSHWEGAAKSLTENYKVVLLDLPGFGNSSAPPRAFDIYNYSEFIEQFINNQKIKDIILIGHSMGGKISIVLASKSKKIKQLFLISPSGLEKRSSLTLIKILTFKTLKSFFPLMPTDLRNKIYRYFASSDYQRAGVLKETFKKIISQNVKEEAKNIKAPTIIIWGENDTEVNLKYAKELRSLIKDSHTRIVWKIGHSPNIENPEKLSSLLLEYL